MARDWERELSEARVDEAARVRREANRGADLAAGELSMDAVLRSLGGSSVSVWTRGGGRHVGVLGTVTPEVLLLRTVVGGRCVVDTDAVVAVAAAPVATNPVDDAVVVVGATLASRGPRLVDTIAEFVEHRGAICAWEGATAHEGTPESVSDEVLAMRTRNGSRLYLAVRSVTAVEDAPSSR